MDKRFPNGKVLRLVRGDITALPCDAIVNAANSQLAAGGGVDGAIRRAGGRAIGAELDLIRASEGGCETGSAVATTAGNLPARFVLHAVGPVYRGGSHGEGDLLASCYRKCLELADERGVRSIHFPSISTGVFGYPVDEAAPIALQTVSYHLERPASPIETVTFVLFDDVTLEAYEKASRD